MKTQDLFDQSIWTETIEKVYGFKSHVFTSKDGSHLTMTHIRSHFMKNILVSGAFVSHIKPVIKSQAGLDEVIDQAIKYCKEKDCDYIELRTSIPLNLDWELVDDNVTFRIDLMQGHEYVFRKMRISARGAIRKGEKSRLFFKIDPGLIDEFYDIYSACVRRLGTPVHGFNFFSEMINRGDDFNVIVVYSPDKKPISAALFAQDADAIYPFASGGLVEYNHLSAESFKYWKLLVYGCENGKKYFDFGRSSKNSGTYDFKKRWFAEEVQLYYYYYFNKNRKPVTKQSMSYKVFSKTWKKLPLKVTRLVGPSLRKYIP